MPELDDDPIVKNSNEARGGLQAGSVTYMLLVGVCVIIIAFIGVYVWNFW
jgi:hypothetical protein